MRQLGPLAVALSLALMSAVSAQTYPARTVEVTVAFPAGAVTDTLGRSLSEGLTQHFGQRFMVVNKPGATGAIGTTAVARANPDGYALLFVPAVSLTVLPMQNKQVGYDLKNFDVLCQTFKNEMVIISNPNSPLKSVADIIAAARAKSGQVSYGHLGVASIPHLAMTELSLNAKVEFNAIPLKGDTDTMAQVLGGHVDFGAVVLSSAVGGGANIIALFGEQRNPTIPNVPTLRELGYDVAPVSFGGLVGPAGLPAEVKTKLYEGCKAAATSEAYSKLARSLGQPIDFYADAAEFARRLDKDVADKARLLKILGEIK
jgi:tripartite-type tricarboxylate transporter receptor subunit TctC